MTPKEARKILKYHSFTDEDINHPKMKNGFLGILRPFSGELIEANYHEVMAAIKTLANEIRDKEKIDKEVISSIWGICHLARNWGIEKGGMLCRNNLISEEQRKRLEIWVETISYTTMMILNGSDNSTAFELYLNE